MEIIPNLSLANLWLYSASNPLSAMMVLILILLESAFRVGLNKRASDPGPLPGRTLRIRCEEQSAVMMALGYRRLLP